MTLDELTIINFRRFKELNIYFHPELTVIAANNGQGKTSVLDAATIALGTFIGAFDLGKAKHIHHNDARYHRNANMSESEQVFPVRVVAKLSHFEFPVIRELNSAKSKTTIQGAAELTKYGKTLMEQVRNLEPVELPVMAYYGSGRLWNAHKNMSRKAVLSESRTMGYEDCFSSASSFTQVQQWMNKATFAALQQQTMDAYSDYKIDEQIKGIQETVNTVLNKEGWSNFHYSVQHEELAMTHQEIGFLPVSMLSDGIRAMVSMVADLAWRCAKLNPQMGTQAQQQTKGIVFIDEVDMHLHPKWQQTVISALRQAFPKIQFIVTTHSPQVLSTVNSENIRVLFQTVEEESEVVSPAQEIKGIESAVALSKVMGVNPVPPVPEAKWIADYTAKIENGTHEDEEGQHLREKLLALYGLRHPILLDADKLIRFQAFKLRKNGHSQER